MEEGGIIYYDDFRGTGDSHIATRLRAQEEIHQKASAALADEVSIIVMSGDWIFFVVIFSSV